MFRGNGNSKVSPTNQPTNGLTWVGARDTCVSKKRLDNDLFYVQKRNQITETCKRDSLMIVANIVMLCTWMLVMCISMAWVMSMDMTKKAGKVVLTGTLG